MTFETTVKINCACMNIDIVTTVNWTNHADESWAYEHPANLIVSIAYCYRSCMVHWECMTQYSRTGNACIFWQSYIIMNKVQETNWSINWELGYMRSFFEVQEDSRIDFLH